MDDKPITLLKSAFSFLSGTAFSRVTGLIRDMSTAFCFGADPAIAAFLVAYRFSSLLRRVFGEGALLTSFIPHFESYRGESPKQAAIFFTDLFYTLVFVLMIVIALAEVGAYGWLTYGSLSTSNREIVQLTMIMLPSLLFLCLYSLCSGLLQCEKHYFLPGIAPVSLNLVWIAAVWYYRELPPSQAVFPLAISIVLACFIQWIFTLPHTLAFLFKHLSVKEALTLNIFSPAIYSLLGSVSMGIIGVSAVQVNSAIDTLFARYSSLQGPAFLNYAIHLEQLPLALFGIAIASALLPPLSRAIKEGDYQKYQDLLDFAISKTLLLLIPCSVAIFALGAVSINLIYGRGDFDNEATLQTTLCLWGYGIGLVPMAIGLLLAPAFFAKKDFWTPTLGSLLSIVGNVLLNSLFIIGLKWGPASLAVATSISAVLNTLYLHFRLSKLNRFSLSSSLVLSSWKVTVGSVASGIITLWVGNYYIGDPSLGIMFGNSSVIFERDLTLQFIQFMQLSTLYFGSIVFFLALFYRHQIYLLKGIIQNRKNVPSATSSPPG